MSFEKSSKDQKRQKMTKSVQSGYKTLPYTIKIAEQTSIDQGKVEIERSICDIFAELNDIYANSKKLTSFIDSCISIQVKKEQENENQG